MASQTDKRRICFVVTNRASYARIRTAIKAVQEDDRLELQLVLGASMVLHHYGNAAENVLRDGFNPTAIIHCVVEGGIPATMVKTTGLAILELSSIFENLQPDVVLTVADRFETIATAISASYMNIPVAHTQGGEITGSIDESVRHAVTKLAHLHFPATASAGRNIIAMGEPEDTVHVTGCPSIDNLHGIDLSPLNAEFVDNTGVGQTVDAEQPYLLVMQHPVTTEFFEAADQIDATLAAVAGYGLPAIWLWPNMDAGTEAIAKHVREFREKDHEAKFHFFRNLPIEQFARLMKNCSCMIGNSSAALREGAFLGTPVVNIGSRQTGRERGPNVVDVSHDQRQICDAIARQIDHGPYPQDSIFGDGKAGKRIAKILAQAKFSIQKRLTFPT
ncbi:MAG: UDP-N-acetylglucosamine 2-epimerase [Alphaproteobacteria bacterium]|nr:UDP-N-acetylglucosamine 2-epimerase [Alphaproteobacteria bacterium]